MIRVGSATITELRCEMARIRRQGNHLSTNYFNQCNHCTEVMPCWVGDNAVAFQWIDNGVPRIYFYAVDDAELEEILRLMEDGCCIDYLTKDKDEKKELFTNAGYFVLSVFGRISKTINLSKANNKKDKATANFATPSENRKKESVLIGDGAGCARVEDAEEIAVRMREVFDPYESHFYDMETLREYIRRGWIYIVRREGIIVACKIFEVHGKTLYNAHIFNNGTSDDFVLLAKVSDAAIRKFGCKYLYGWQDIENRRVMRMNIKLAKYRFDGLYDVIYVKGKKKDIYRSDC